MTSCYNSDYMKKTTKNQVKLTKNSFEALQKELQDLRDNQLPIVVERIAKAREQGDLSENSEYKDAKDQQELLEVRIGEIEAILSKSQVVEEKRNAGAVGVGSVVTLVDAEKKTATYTIVGEFDKAAGETATISSVSPIGSSLMHKQVGEEICVQVPAGERKWKIKAIK